ncbi:hypothetical protein RFS42_004183 [Vibrio vulnificus]|nr:hypothetical protein [Vibrio vulnificus]
MIIKCLKLYDKPVRKALFDTVVTVVSCLFWPALYVLSQLAIEYLELPWKFTCFVEAPCSMWERLVDFMKVLFSYVLEYSLIIPFILMLLAFTYYYVKEMTNHAMAVKVLYEKAITPLFITYFTAVIVHGLLHIEKFESSVFLSEIWEPVYAYGGLKFILLTVLGWFVINFALNYQNARLAQERLNRGEKSIGDRIHEYRKKIIEEFGQ